MTRLAMVYGPQATHAIPVSVDDNGEYLPIISFLNPAPLPDARPLRPEECRLDIPLPFRPSKMIAVGLNYPAHIAEMKHDKVPTDPVLFMKSPSSLVPSGDAIIADADWGQVDYEGELAVVIGQRCKDISEEQAMEMVWGFTLANDVTARAMQKQEKQWGRSKNCDTFCPLGPYLLLNAGQDFTKFNLRTLLDNKVVQDDHIGSMKFSIPFIISHISKCMTLEPGDVILTGTPNGVGPLSDGQAVRIGIDEIGWLENPVRIRQSASVNAR